MKNKQQNQDPLYIAKFNGMVDFISEVEMKTIRTLIDKRGTTKELISIKQMGGIDSQRGKIGHLICELKQRTEILQHLLEVAYKVHDKKQEHIDILENISFTIHDIKDKCKSTVQQLDEILEVENVTEPEPEPKNKEVNNG